MGDSAATRFFDTTGCLNLSRPTSGARVKVTKEQRHARPAPGSGLIRGQLKIDLYNFDHIDFADSKYVLTSPRSLEACARLNIKPATLLPTTLADLSSNKVRFSTLVDIRDEMEVERLANLQRCRDERERIIREETATKTNPGSFLSASRQPRSKNAPASVHFAPMPSEPVSTSTGFLDEVFRLDKSLQRRGTAAVEKNDDYIHGLEGVKHAIEQHAAHAASNHELEALTFEKKQHELLLSHYDHELKMQKARENVRRTEKEKDAERYDSLMHDVLDQNMAEERRQNELRRKLDRMHHSRQLYEALQAKNHELQNMDSEKRRAELLKEIKRKDRRTEHFVKDKEDTVKLSRALAKSSQDARQYVKETRENFDQRVKHAELTTNLLITKPKVPIDRRHLQSALQT